MAISVGCLRRGPVRSWRGCGVWAAVCVALGGALMVSGCERPPAAGTVRVSDLTPPTSPPSATYVVRGEVVSLPITGKPQTELIVKHEAIDDFKDRDGKVVGMNAMEMEFPPAKGVDVRDLKVGEKVAVTFSVWWTQTPPWLATKIERLPPETQLEFRKKRKLP